MKVIKMFAVLLGLLFISQIVSAQVKDIDAVKEKAESGDAQAQYLLGWCYGTGNAGLAQDYYMATVWLEKAAQQGYEAAQYFLGWCYYYGHGVKKDYKQAEHWYGEAAKQGNAEAASMVKLLSQLENDFSLGVVQGDYLANTFDAANPPILTIVPNSVQFVDPNGNNAIDADETCFINFKVENTGTGAAINSIAKIGTSEPIKGLKFRDVIIPKIMANEIKEVNIPISATDMTVDANVNLYVQVSEPHGFGTEAFTLQVDTRKFEPPFLQIVDYVASSSSESNVLKKKEKFTLQVLLQNTKPGTAKNVDVSISLPENVMLQETDKKHVSYVSVSGGVTKSIEYPLIVTQNYSSNEIPIKLHVQEKYGKYAEDKTINLKLEQSLGQKIVVQSEQQPKQQSYDIQIASLSSDVDKNIPISKETNENTFALIIANESYKNVESVPFAANTKSIEYPLIVTQNYSSNEIPIKLHVQEKYGKYAEDKTINLKLEQSLGQKIVVQSEQQPKQQSYDIQIASLSSDVDKNIPISKETNENTFALIIANESYKNVESVPFAANDGSIFSEYCKKTLGISEKHIYLALNATLNDIKHNIDLIGQAMDAYNGEAQIIVYYAGHGIPNEADKSAYLLPVDGYSSNVETGYSLKDLYAALSEHPAKSVTVFLDACFSGTKREGDMLASARGVAIKVDETVPVGNMVVFAASQGDETAYPYKNQGHGMFTYFLLKKLQETEGDVSLGDLSEYVIDQVRKTSIDENEKMQTPTITPADKVQNEWKNWTLK